MESLILTCVGLDRPGIVQDLARLVSRHGANWEASRMAHLSGHFAGIVHVHGSALQLRGVRDELPSVNIQGLLVTATPSRAEGAPANPPMLIELVGHDRPGIVQEVSSVLTSLAVNVEELHTECLSAAMSGEALFKARIQIRLPENVSTRDMLDGLEALAPDLMADIIE